jgi:hypothetical protein
MRKRTLLLSFTVALFAFAPTAAASPPTSGSGDEAFTSLTTTLVRVADGNAFFANSGTGVVRGMITGTWTTEFTTLVRSSGEIVVKGTFTCDCSVGGRSGTFTTQFEGTGAAGPPPTLTAPFETIAATGGLAGLHLKGTAQQVGATITYSGTIHFDP